MSGARVGGAHLASGSTVIGFVLTLVVVVLVIVWWFRSPPQATHDGASPHPIYGRSAHAQADAAAPDAKPAAGASVVVVDLDGVRADHLGFLAYSRDTSPNLDVLAGESLRFEWAFAQAPSLAASRASTWSGLYPSHLGRSQGGPALPERVATLAERLSGAGYHTAAFVDGPAMQRGSGFEQGFERYDDAGGGLERMGPRIGAFLDEREADGAPFLLVVQSDAVGAPYDPPEPFRSRFAGDAAASGNAPESADGRRALYDAELAAVDAWIGGFADDLRRRGLYEGLLIAVVADGGEALGEHPRADADALYAPRTRIPLLLRLPHAAVRAGVDAPVEAIDLVPTLLDALALAPSDGVDGESLLPLALGEPQGAERMAISEAADGARIAVATRRYRLHLQLAEDRSELFAYRDDPLELHDVASQDAEYVDVISSAAKVWRVIVEGRLEPEKDVHWLRRTALGQLESLPHGG